jgi:8-oxo-dGTP pyrophosphatase MutT (NUDIX family)
MLIDPADREKRVADTTKRSQSVADTLHGEQNENPWVQQSRAIAYQNDWIVVYHDNVVRPDGQPGIYGVVHYRSRAVGVVAIDQQDRVLLVGQFRYATGRYSWEIPAGGAPEGEDPLATARRELREETGFTAASMQLILRADMSNSISDEEGLCYLATDLVSGESCPEGTERLQVRWLPFKDAVELVWRGEITDALTILGLQCVTLLRMEGKATGL